jgi:MerR family redox-sensitive transcriptional activator SoxR
VFVEQALGHAQPRHDSGWRTDGNQRRYGRDVLRRVALIRVAQMVGISLADLAAALATLPTDVAPSRAD